MDAFSSNDPLQAGPLPYASITDPRSLNKYGYTYNNPLRYTDPSGHFGDFVTGGEVADNLDSAVDQATANVQASIASSGVHPTVASIASSGVNAVSSGIKGFTDFLRLGEGTGEALSALDGGDTEGALLAASEDMGRGGAMLLGIAGAGLVAERANGATGAPDSVPASRGPKRPTAAEQRGVNEIGERTGCHTCGTRDPGTKSGNFVGDHQPSSALTKPGEKQVLKPQCLRCSQRQGGRVRQEKARRARDE